MHERQRAGVELREALRVRALDDFDTRLAGGRRTRHDQGQGTGAAQGAVAGVGVEQQPEVLPRLVVADVEEVRGRA